MGTVSVREKIESKMLKLKLRRIEIKQERSERIQQLEKLTGKEVIREPIPDYIDHSEDEINPEDIDNESDEENEEEIVNTKKKKKEKAKSKSKSKKNKHKKETEEQEDDNDSEYEDKIKKKKKKRKTTKHQVTKE